MSVAMFDRLRIFLRPGCGQVRDNMMTLTRALLIVGLSLFSPIAFLAAQDGGTPMPPEPQRVELPESAGEALYWEGGPQAVLLAHGAVYDAASWTDQAEVMQAEGYSVLSLENIDAEAIVNGIAWLVDDQGAAGVVVIGASAGGGGVLRALESQPQGISGLVLLGATGSVEPLGDYPKLFTASEGEGMTDRLKTMADAAAGDENRVEIIPGSAHAQATFQNPEGDMLLEVILRFLEDDAAWPEDAGTPVA